MSQTSEELNEEFFSQNNFDTLAFILNTSLQNKLGLNLDTEYPEYKSILFKHMSDTFDSEDFEKTMDILNKECLKLTLQKLLTDLEKSHLEKTIPDEMATPIDALELLDENDCISEEEVNDMSELTKLSENQIIEENKESLTFIEGKKLPYSELPEFDDLPEIPEISEKIHDETIFTVDINSKDRLNINDGININAYSFSVTLGGHASSNGIKTQSTIKNVSRVKLNHIIVPSVNENISRYPYLYIHINEFPGQYIGSSDYASKAFACVLRDKDWDVNSTNLHYCVLFAKESPGWQSNTPIASISRLTFQIMNPYGEIINTEPDYIDLTNASISFDGSLFAIDFPRFFSTEQFNTNHSLVFDNVSLSDFDLKTFLEKSCGHIIMDIENEGVSSKFYKTIYISPKKTSNYATGSYTLDTYSLTSNSPPLLFNAGNVLNVSKQTSISLEFTTKTYQSLSSQIIV
jgi:hypothetical protein